MIECREIKKTFWSLRLKGFLYFYNYIYYYLFAYCDLLILLAFQPKCGYNVATFH